jgi:amino-acid N-acetyltransferase
MASLSVAIPVTAYISNLDIRKACLRDIPSLLSLINEYASAGAMLPRTEFEMSENIRDFTVVYSGKKLLACGALHFYTPTSGEVRSLAVDPTLKTQGLGRLVVSSLEDEAIANELHAIFAFTYVPNFFRKVGFRAVERGVLPLKVWKDCLRCPKFQRCDEIAVLKALRPDPVLSPAEAPSTSLFDPEFTLIQLPNLKNSDD